MDPYRVHRAALGQTELGPALAIMEEESLTLVLDPTAPSERHMRVRFDTIDAIRESEGVLAIQARDGGVLLLELEQRRALVDGLRAGCRAIPELTRGLRALGRRASATARQGRAGEEARFFAPFLAARRAAAAAPDAEALLASFDPDTLRVKLDTVIDGFAAERAGARAPLRRSIEAELGELVEPVHLALETLAEARALASEDVDDLARWREWAVRLRALFQIADRAWMELDAALARRPAAIAPRTAIVALVAALALGAPVTAQAQDALRMVRVPGVVAESLSSRGFDVVGVRDGAVILVVSDVEDARLRSLGFSPSPMPTPALPAGVAAAVTTVYRPFDDPVRGVRAFLDSLDRESTRVRVDSFGASFEGRPMLAAKIGPAEDSPARPNVIIMATYHAREWAATEMALRLLRHLATTSDVRIDSLVANRDIWIIPVANPDGYQYTFDAQRLWRKTRRPVQTQSGVTVYGVDLNRNHTGSWGFDNIGSSPSANSEVYRGPSPASEPETQAIERFHQEHPPITSISYHTFSGLLLHPPGFASGLMPPDRSIFQALTGTEVRSAVIDRLPASGQPFYRPGPGWLLYPTNGDYTDFAYGRHGTIAFTPELTSGEESGIFYGFQFPDDEERLRILFQDNLPFALDVIESARDPLRYVSANTGRVVEPLILEAIAPAVQLTAPKGSSVTVRAPGTVPMAIDPLVPGKYIQRWRATSLAPRPSMLSVRAGNLQSDYLVLSASGAEAGETGWTASGYIPSTPVVAGTFAWRGSIGTLRSPAVTVPMGIDTVSVIFWSRFDGDGFSIVPRGELRVSTDDGATWSLLGRYSGEAPVYYAERATIAGVAGKTVRVEFTSPDGMQWWLDEIALIGHRAIAVTDPEPTQLLPNANPLRTDAVRFTWPFGAAEGELRAYDFGGRMVWRTAVAGGSSGVEWQLADRLANGVYLVVAESAGIRRTFTLFVTRPGR